MEVGTLIFKQVGEVLWPGEIIAKVDNVRVLIKLFKLKETHQIFQKDKLEIYTQEKAKMVSSNSQPSNKIYVCALKYASVAFSKKEAEKKKSMRQLEQSKPATKLSFNPNVSVCQQMIKFKEEDSDQLEIPFLGQFTSTLDCMFKYDLKNLLPYKEKAQKYILFSYYNIQTEKNDTITMKSKQFLVELFQHLLSLHYESLTEQEIAQATKKIKIISSCGVLNAQLSKKRQFTQKSVQIYERLLKKNQLEYQKLLQALQKIKKENVEINSVDAKKQARIDKIRALLT